MSISTQNLGEALVWIAVFLAVVAAIAGVTVWIARRRGSTTIALDATVAIAQVWLAVLALGAVFATWQWLFEGERWIDRMPVTLDWPDPLPAGAGEGGAQLLWANIPDASATVAGLGIGIRLVFVVATLLSLAVLATPAALMLVIGRQMLRGTPFTRRVSSWLFASAIVVLVAGVAVEIIEAIGRTLVARAVLPGWDSGAAATTQGLFSLTVPLWPFAAALALAALGAVFRHGAALQRETEGLV